MAVPDERDRRFARAEAACVTRIVGLVAAVRFVHRHVRHELISWESVFETLGDACAGEEGDEERRGDRRGVKDDSDVHAPAIAERLLDLRPGDIGQQDRESGERKKYLLA